MKTTRKARTSPPETPLDVVLAEITRTRSVVEGMQEGPARDTGRFVLDTLQRVLRLRLSPRPRTRR